MVNNTRGEDALVWRRRAWVSFLTAGLVALSSGLAQEAHAQEEIYVEDEDTDIGDELPVGNPEFGPRIVGPDKAEDKRLTTEFSVRSEIHAYDNLDFRGLDESSDQAIIDSDDRHTFAYSNISAFLSYQVHPTVRVNLGMSHNGLWSEDQLGSEAELSGALFFSHLNTEYTPVNNDAFELTFRFGRQPFKIGGVPLDYVLDDILDCVVLEADARKAGRLRVLAFDLFTSNDNPSASFVRYVSGREVSLGLRGDTFSLRSGAVYENDALIDGLTFKAYGFYSRIAGGPIEESGADISYGGALGNFSDNDFVWVAGARAAYDLRFGDAGGATFYGEFAHSGGIDRKEVVARDVEISGNAFGGGVLLDFDTGDVALEGGVDSYYFDGAEYAGDGLRFEHGFVSFRGRRVGGLNTNRYAGWFPSAVLDRDGILFNEHEPERAGGTQFLHAGLGVVFMGKTKLRGDVWSLRDTGSTFLNFADLDNIDPPFGYSREEFFAQSRVGKNLGMEFDLQVEHKFNDFFRAYVVYANFLPGDFYGIEINRVAGNARGSDDPQTFWALTAGTVVDF